MTNAEHHFERLEENIELAKHRIIQQNPADAYRLLSEFAEMHLDQLREEVEQS